MLDATDQAILIVLQQHARISNKELAARIGLAPSSCLERVRRLQHRGVLTGFHAEVDPKALGIHVQAIVAVRLSRHTIDHVVTFREYALSLPEVIRLSHVSGRIDFLVHVVVRDMEHLRTVALEAFSTRPEVDRIETNLIFEHSESHGLPIFIDADD